MVYLTLGFIVNDDIKRDMIISALRPADMLDFVVVSALSVKILISVFVTLYGLSKHTCSFLDAQSTSCSRFFAFSAFCG